MAWSRRGRHICMIDDDSIQIYKLILDGPKSPVQPESSLPPLPQELTFLMLRQGIHAAVTCLSLGRAWGRQVDFTGAPESQPKAFQKGRRRSESKNTTVLTSRSIAPAPSDCVGGLSVPCANIMWPVCCLTGTYVAPLSPLMCVNLSTLLNPPNSHLPHLWRWIATLLWELNMLIHSKCPGINWALN